MKKLILLFSLTFLFTQVLLAQTTEIWIVRHGEKDKTDPKNTDPDLSVEGKKRANDLAAYFSKAKFSAAFSTPYKRTRQVLAPLVQKNSINIAEYQNADTLASTIKKNYAGKTVIVAGHSNTILEIIEAFGLQRPVAVIKNSDYDYIFQVILDGDHGTVKTDFYGKSTRP